ncbi:MAG: aminopeptidase P family protein [Prevotellaceae bacterium]|jgi:Xaa-Pro aminopeptidase|nr:aminopeptidase P family protein [Prevotellaceae bacterium]
MNTERLIILRARMKAAGFDAVAITGIDPHLGVNAVEYPDYLKYFSGVGASAGLLVVTADKSALTVDSRYYVMAKEKLRDTEMSVLLAAGSSRAQERGIIELTAPDAAVGFDARRMSATAFAKMRDSLAPRIAKDAGALFAGFGLASPAAAKVFLLDAAVAGESRREKLARLAAWSEKGEIRVVSALDDIAWLLNIRATAGGYCPVPVARLLIDYPRVRLFLAAEISAADAAALEADGIELMPYTEFANYAASAVAARRAAAEPDRTDFALFEILRRSSAALREETRPEATPAAMKAVKNETELAGFRRCMIAEGAALTRFIRWLTDAMDSGGASEAEAAQQLEIFRREASPEYIGPSFGTIAAYGANAAMPHYRPAADSCAMIRRDSFFLLDSGGQYATGTTDVTRTFHFGNPSREERAHYTLVLKGMIGLSTMVFPEGTCGTQLDMAARRPLWEHGLNYSHGTGHGVGHILNVHEGPQSIRAEYNPTPIMPGMVVSNEPAVYLEGKYGIRIENLLACRRHSETEFGSFLSFETLTVCPIDTAPVIPEMMTDAEIEFISGYNENCRKILDSITNV